MSFQNDRLEMYFMRAVNILVLAVKPQSCHIKKKPAPFSFHCVCSRVDNEALVALETA